MNTDGNTFNKFSNVYLASEILKHIIILWLKYGISYTSSLK